jgi:hypothetical protein
MKVAKLMRFKVELELCGPEHASHEDVYEYIASLMRESDIAAINDVFAVGQIEVEEDGECTVEEWNGDPVDEIDIEEMM